MIWAFTDRLYSGAGSPPSQWSFRKRNESSGERFWSIYLVCWCRNRDKSRYFLHLWASYNVNKNMLVYEDATESVLCVDAFRWEMKFLETFDAKFFQLDKSWPFFPLVKSKTLWMFELVSLVARTTDNAMLHIHRETQIPCICTHADAMR